MAGGITAVGAALIAVVALAKHHDALAEDATGGIVLATKGWKKTFI
jgi:hypothetical protein